jgi:ADP-ribose pyrophosphatase YjhB (NUDIX family)
MNKLALPGGKVENTDLSLAHACAREAKEEIGFDISPWDLKLLTVLDTPHTDPRFDKRISIVYYKQVPLSEYPANAQAGSDAKEIILVPLTDIKEGMLAFDHFRAINLIQLQDDQKWYG